MKFCPNQLAFSEFDDQRINIWIRPLMSADHERSGALLQSEEWAYCNRMGSQMQRDKFVTGRSLTRTILSRLLGKPQEQLSFTPIKNGKLIVEDHPEIEYNLSFANGLAALAVTKGRRLGFDIEAEEQEFGLDTVARRFFSPDEMATLCATPLSQRCRQFVKIWTLKESFIKATGQGFVTELDQIYFGVNQSGCITYKLSSDDEKNWSFAQLDLLPGLIGAVCLEAPAISFLNIRVWFLSDDGRVESVLPKNRCRSQGTKMPMYSEVQ